MTRSYLIAGALGASLSASALADPIYELTVELTLSGISADSAYQAAFDAQFSVGQSATFVFVYDAGTAATPTSANVDEYDGAVVSATAAVGGYAVASTPSSDSSVVLKNGGNTGGLAGDHVQMAAFSNPPSDYLDGAAVGGAFPELVQFILTDTTDNTWPGAGVSPGPLAALTDFTAFNAPTSANYIGFHDGTGSVATLVFDFDSVSFRIVPAPGAMGVVALGGLAAARRRR